MVMAGEWAEESGTVLAARWESVTVVKSAGESEGRSGMGWAELLGVAWVEEWEVVSAQGWGHL